MTSGIFLLITVAMVLGWRGYKPAGVAVFVAAALLALVWFNHHATDALQLGL
jgi:UDP-N-acetylmuramyl pentapeptide phosphotransferase/UDP-N-acetylglucosamine-1-phosphate transferase